MKVYKIDSATASAKYRGSGVAFAAIKGGVVVDLVYLSNILDQDDDDADELVAIKVEREQRIRNVEDTGDLDSVERLLSLVRIHSQLDQALIDARMHDALKLLRTKGLVRGGMCSCWEFVSFGYEPLDDDSVETSMKSDADLALETYTALKARGVNLHKALSDHSILAEIATINGWFYLDNPTGGFTSCSANVPGAKPDLNRAADIYLVLPREEWPEYMKDR